MLSEMQEKKNLKIKNKSTIQRILIQSKFIQMFWPFKIFTILLGSFNFQMKYNLQFKY